MAYHDTQSTVSADIFRRLAGATKSVLAVIGEALVAGGSANRRLRLVERLNAKSDAELAEMGLRREDIVRRVFIDMPDV